MVRFVRLPWADVLALFLANGIAYRASGLAYPKNEIKHLSGKWACLLGAAWRRSGTRQCLGGTRQGRGGAGHCRLHAGHFQAGKLNGARNYFGNDFHIFEFCFIRFSSGPIKCCLQHCLAKMTHFTLARQHPACPTNIPSITNKSWVTKSKH